MDTRMINSLTYDETKSLAAYDDENPNARQRDRRAHIISIRAMARKARRKRGLRLPAVRRLTPRQGRDMWLSVPTQDHTSDPDLFEHMEGRAYCGPRIAHAMSYQYPESDFDRTNGLVSTRTRCDHDGAVPGRRMADEEIDYVRLLLDAQSRACVALNNGECEYNRSHDVSLYVGGEHVRVTSWRSRDNGALNIFAYSKWLDELVIDRVATRAMADDVFVPRHVLLASHTSFLGATNFDTWWLSSMAKRHGYKDPDGYAGLYVEELMPEVMYARPDPRNWRKGRSSARLKRDDEVEGDVSATLTQEATECAPL